MFLSKSKLIYLSLLFIYLVNYVLYLSIYLCDRCIHICGKMRESIILPALVPWSKLGIWFSSRSVHLVWIEQAISCSVRSSSNRDRLISHLKKSKAYSVIGNTWVCCKALQYDFSTRFFIACDPFSFYSLWLFLILYEKYQISYKPDKKHCHIPSDEPDWRDETLPYPEWWTWLTCWNRCKSWPESQQQIRKVFFIRTIRIRV